MTPLRAEESIPAWVKDYPDFSLLETKDCLPLSIHSSPKVPWNFEAEEEAIFGYTFEAEEEKLKNRPDTAFYRSLRRAVADKRAECQREAEALGFSSWEAKERHDWEKRRKRLEEHFKERGHLPQPPPITEQQREVYERKQREVERESLKRRCHCRDHVAWWFCPQRLRSYKSLGPGSSNFHFLQALHPTDINVHIEEGDPSKRVPEEWLESVVWAMPSRSRVLHLPLWAKWDDVVQHMINREEVDEILYYGDPELQKKPPPPRRTVTSSVSSWPDSEVEHNAEVLRGLERQDPPEEGAAGPKQSLSKSTTNVDVALASPPADFNTWLSEIESHLAGKPSAHGQVRDASDLGVHEPGSHLAGEPSAHGQVRDASDLGVHETVRISEARSSKIHKPPEAKKEATRKAALFKKIQTHAQDILNLLAEESGACATSLSHH